MKRLLFGLLVAVTSVLGMLLLPLPNAAIGSPREKPQEKKIYGETRPAAALVYIYRKDKRRALRVFCDTQLVAVTRTNTYTFAYVSPGTHLFWSDWGYAGLCDFAAGQTYYLSFNLEDREQMSILSESDGQVAIKKANRYVELRQEDYRKAEGKISKNWPEFKVREASRLKPPGGESYAPPATTENMTRVPAGTAVVAELMENLNSRFNNPDDAVWFRAAEDVYIDRKLFVLKDAPIKAVIRGAKEGRNFRRIGKLDLTVVSVAAADGTVCPLVGQVRTIGVMGSGAAATALFLAGGPGPAVAVAAVTKGPEAFYAAGEAVKVFTRHDIWIKPLQSRNELTSAVVKLSATVKAYARGKIACDFRKGKIPQVVEIMFEGASDISSAELLRVAGWEIPTPVHASKLSRVKEGWIAQFSGWDLCRFLRPGEVGTQLMFGLTASDGTIVIAQAAVPLTLQ